MTDLPPQNFAELPGSADEEAATAQLRAIVDWIDSLQGEERRDALVEYRRSDLWHPLLSLAAAGIGSIAREAYETFDRDILVRDTWERRWNEADPICGRGSIARLTGCDGAPGWQFATHPFRAMTDQDGEPVIGAAIGCARFFEPLDWYHVDIRDVVLWDPRRRTARLAGEAAGASAIVLPDDKERVTVYRDPAAFFRDWAAARLAFLDRRPKLRLHDPHERRDNELPGALVIGDLDGVGWRFLGLDKLIPGPGVTRHDLQRAVLRSARLPAVLPAIGGAS